MPLGNYSDHPDGKQCFQKMAVASKYSGMLGITVGIADVIMKTKPEGYVPTIATFLRTGLPIVGSGVTFAAITCAATSFRGKDDKVNYMIGGASAGGVFGVAARSFKVGVPLAIAFAVVAVLYKDSKDNGWTMFPAAAGRRMIFMEPKDGGFSFVKERR